MIQVHDGLQTWQRMKSLGNFDQGVIYVLVIVGAREHMPQSRGRRYRFQTNAVFLPRLIEAGVAASR